MRSNHENALLHVIIRFRVTVKFRGKNCPRKVIFHFFSKFPCYLYIVKKCISCKNHFTKTNIFPSFASFERQHFWQVLRCVQQGDQTYNVFSFVNVFEEKAYLAKPLAPNLLLDTSFLTWAAAICLLPHVFLEMKIVKTWQRAVFMILNIMEQFQLIIAFYSFISIIYARRYRPTVR